MIFLHYVLIEKKQEYNIKYSELFLKNPNENFHIIISELANIDLKTFLKENYPKDKNELYNILV